MPSNAHISWDGKASHPKDNKTRTVDIVWGSNPYTWGDVSLAAEISPFLDGSGTRTRRQREKDLNDHLNFEKKKRLIKLIMRMKGDKVYEKEKETGKIKIKLEDAKLVVNDIFKQIKVERTLSDGTKSEIVSYEEEKENVV